MSYYSLRITSPLLDSIQDLSGCCCDVPAIALVYDFIKKHISPKGVFPWVLAIENLDKYLEKCATHLHFNFHSSKKLKSLQRLIRLAGFTGNKMYSLTRHEEVDHTSFFGYCLKQESAIYDSNLPGEILYPMRIKAVHQRELAAVYHKKCRAKAMEKNSLADRLCLDISNNPVKLSSYREIYLFILQWYVEHSKGVCHKTIQAHTQLYRLKHKLLSFSEFYDTFHSSSKSFF